MCDSEQLASWAKSSMTRRGFGGTAMAAGAVACAPLDESATASGDTSSGATMRAVSFGTGAGTLDGEFYTAGSTPRPGVIFWPDIAGIRPAKRQMASRLAEAGYAVLLANPYYRDVAGQQFEDFAGFAGSGGFQKVSPWREKFTPETIRLDNGKAAAWLMEQDEVDTGRGIGVQGYCMTGSFAVYGPWSEERITAGASFHGGGLVRDSENSPHRVLQEDAHYLVAIAQNDDAKAPGDDDAIRARANEAESLEVEVYPADHGWCVLDSPSYDREQAERAWARLLALYEGAL